jgi:hypothetical protein
MSADMGVVQNKYSKTVSLEGLLLRQMPQQKYSG